MYMDKEVKRGYNEYLRLDEGEGKDGMMDVALLVMEAGDTYTIEEADKEVACLLNFSSEFAFSRFFKKHMGEAPNHWRKNPLSAGTYSSTKSRNAVL